MSEQELLEQAPLFALGALDGAERAAFEAALATSPRLQEEVRSFEQVVAMLPLDVDRVATSAAARRHVLDSGASPSKVAGSAQPVVTWLAIAAALILGFNVWVLRSNRDEVREQMNAARAREAELIQLNTSLQSDLEKARRDAAQSAVINRLLGTAQVRLVAMGPQPKFEGRARAIYNTVTREAVLLVAGLPKAPAGKAYEVWVISGPVPTPAGVFQVNDDGTALVVLPNVEETSRVKTFAITLEPAEGVPAPTGPIVLAGNAS